MSKFVKIFFCLIILLTGYYYFFCQLKTEREKFLQSNFVDYTLPSRFIGPISLEFKGLTSDFLLFKFMTFIGGKAARINEFDDKYWTYIIDSLKTITDLDPYFWDAYLFGEMFLTWQAGKIEAANNLLLKARKYRPNDYRPPYYLGFHYYYYYFLKDNVKAAKYFMEASKLPNCHYYLASLAARLSVFNFQHKVGITFLKEMLKGQTDQRIIKEFKMRIATLEFMDFLEHKVSEFEKIHKKLPGSLQELVTSGLIKSIPVDPYGGKFVLMSNGRVYTTSKMLMQK